MKNQYDFKAQWDGVLELVKVKPEQNVPKDFLMVKFQAEK